MPHSDYYFCAIARTGAHIACKGNTMPELPEVQTIVNELNSHVLPRTVIGLRECRPGTVVRRTDAPEPWRITRASRRGKFIVLHGEHNIRLVAHLRYDGQVRVPVR
jgi:formamidopyrimidine-DNA glycosylase